MNVLALEFSSPVRSVAVFGNKTVLGRAEQKGMRETNAFALIDAALHDASITRDAVDRIAVGLGPGSYAGIRIAIAIARGWHIANGAEIVGLSSADCVAHQVQHDGEFTVMVDAQRGEFYGARYQKSNDRIDLLEPFHMLTEELGPGENNARLFIRPDVLEDGRGWRAVPPDAAILGKLAAGVLNATSAHELNPIYLRRAEFVKATPPRIFAD